MTLPVAGAVDQSRPRTLLDLVGNTPLLRLRRFERADGRVRLYAKAEWRNPGGSVKDRAAAAMILDGERQGLLTPGKTILDATSGNTGIAYAMMGAARGYAVKLCMPSNVTPERKRILRAYGAELVLTDPMEGSDGAIRKVRQLFADDPEPYLLSGSGTATRSTGARTTTRPVRSCSRKPRAPLRTSWPASGPAALSWASAATSAITRRTSA